ncbi:MAG: hypothetical protein M5R40_29400 [Anaerolineae bacterium]|nr:hypothetical protein [Anaerolineae bacterium]
MVLTEIDAAFDGADAFFRSSIATTSPKPGQRSPLSDADGTRYAFVTYRRRT